MIAAMSMVSASSICDGDGDVDWEDACKCAANNLIPFHRCTVHSTNRTETQPISMVDLFGAAAGVMNVKGTCERAGARKRARFVDDNNILCVVENSVKTTPWAHKCARLNHFWLHSQLLHKYEWHGCRLFAYRKDATTTTACLLKQFTYFNYNYNRQSSVHLQSLRSSSSSTSSSSSSLSPNQFGMHFETRTHSSKIWNGNWLACNFDASSIFFLYIENTVRPIRHKTILWY